MHVPVTSSPSKPERAFAFIAALAIFALTIGAAIATGDLRGQH